MKIAIDISRAVNEKAGVGRYTFNLVKSLLEIDQENEYLLICSYWRKSPEKEKLLEGFPKSNVRLKFIRIPGRLKEKLWQSRLPLAKKFLDNADVYLAPTFLDVIRSAAIPQALVVHDLTMFIFPEHLGKKKSSYYQKLTKKAAEKAKKIITISEATKKDLVKFTDTGENKIQVIYPGRTGFKQVSEKLPAGLKPKSYLLFVGTLEPRKNLSNLILAYAALAPHFQENYPLAIVGAEGWNTSPIYQMLKITNLGGKIKFLGYLSDDQLALLYREALVFIYPSLYEGFGLPVVEAMGFGVPVVTSNVSSMPEVAGQAAVLVDPCDVKAISTAVTGLLSDAEKRQKLSQQAILEAKKFDWQKTAKKTLEVLKNLIK